MSRTFKVLFLNLLLIFCSMTSIKGDCKILYSEDEIHKPTFYKTVGSYKINMNFRRNTPDAITLHENQIVEAYCENAFDEPSTETNHLFIKCTNGCISTRTHLTAYDYHYYCNTNIFVKCTKIKLSLYESSSNFPWCPKNVTSYLLSSRNNFVGICYDIYDQSFKSIYYTLTPGQPKIMNTPSVLSLFIPKLKIDYLTETFETKSISEQDFSNTQFREWINISNFKFDSIIQHSILYSIFIDLNSMLEFAWWSNLRVYNWKNYISALESHVEKENRTYDILAGVSGTVRVPYIEGCEKNFTTKELTDDENRKIPLYVWNYLQARDNSTKDIVVIGINSPFHEFYTQNDIIFCPDICNDIPWLKKESSSFRYSVMGIVFCCNVEDVKSSKRLQEFPEIDMKIKEVFIIDEKPLDISPKPLDFTPEILDNHETTEAVENYDENNDY
ncbi:uncharacterized protein ACRADG_005492 [Cochliomyia hominivorax]